MTFIRTSSLIPSYLWPRIFKQVILSSGIVKAISCRCCLFPSTGHLLELNLDDVPFHFFNANIFLFINANRTQKQHNHHNIPRPVHKRTKTQKPSISVHIHIVHQIKTQLCMLVNLTLLKITNVRFSDFITRLSFA